MPTQLEKVLLEMFQSNNHKSHVFESDWNEDAMTRMFQSGNHVNLIDALTSSIENSEPFDNPITDELDILVVYKILHCFAKHMYTDKYQRIATDLKLKYCNFIYKYATKYYKGLAQYYTKTHIKDQEILNLLLENAREIPG